MFWRPAAISLLTIVVSACGGGGGGGSDPAPTVTLSANPSAVTTGSSSVLAWDSTDSTTCTASGGWSGVRGIDGVESTSPIAATTSFTLTCTGPGGTATDTTTVTVTTSPPPTLDLSVAPSTISAGSSATLTWSTTNATACAASGGWSGNKSVSGTQGTGALSGNTSYTLTCTGAGGSTDDTVSVTVNPVIGIPTVNLAATPSNVAYNTGTTLGWTTANATACTASGSWSGSKGTSGSEIKGNLTATTSYTLACTGTGGTASQSVTVTVASPPLPMVTLSASPGTVASGASSTLTWNSADATSCTASNGWSGTKATSGSQSTGNLTATSTFTLTCTGVGGSANQSATVTVAPAPTATLSASPTTVASGASSILTWSSANATACTASNGWSGAKATSGSQSTGNLTSTTTYTLTCTGAGGSANQSATVTVTPAPTVTLSANPTSVASGGSSTLTWSSANATACTASNGWSGAKATNGTQSTGNLSSTTTYTLTCTGAGGSANKTATVTVTSGGGGSIFPLRVEAGKRYLVTAQGNPFLVQGDSPWLLITNLTKEDVVTYLDDRQAKGFNTLLVELIERNHSINQPANFYGDPPFSPDPAEFSLPPVDAYFDHAEYVIAQARQRGMLVLLTPSYLGFAGRETGWYPAMGRAGNALLREYGQYVATRFQDHDNVLWVQGGDYNPADRTRLRAVVDGILDVETESLHTFHGSRGTSALGWAGTTEPWLEVNNIYADEDTVMAEAEIEWERPSTMPYFLIEGDYEDESATALETRQQAWQAVLSGAAGQVTGQKSIWLFDPAVWTSKLNTEGASTLIHLRTLLESYAWWTLEPDFANTFLTGGAGTGAARAPAAVAADGSFAFIYTRDIRDLTVDIGALSGSQVQARWYDPTNGSFANVAGSPFAATGSRVFRPTGSNSRGKNDWVLVLDALP